MVSGLDLIVCSYHLIVPSSVINIFRRLQRPAKYPKKKKHLSSFNNVQVSVIFDELPAVNSTKPISNVLQSNILDATLLHF